jgi:Mg2+/Co2+ transporter CorC
MEPADARPAKPTLLERLTALLTREPEDREELMALLRGAFERACCRSPR